MTPQQRDDLATMAGGKRKPGLTLYHRGYYDFPAGVRVCDNWHPEISLDDCRRLFAEIDRRGLRGEFGRNLSLMCPHSA